MAIQVRKYIPHAFAVLLAGACAFTSPWEGERLKAYIPLPGDKPTICDGETHGVFIGMTETHEECQEMLTNTMINVLRQLDAIVKVPLNDNQKIAFADFIYNEGGERFIKSSMLRDLNAGNYVQACNDLLKYDYAEGHKVKGLTARREAERNLCLKP